MTVMNMTTHSSHAAPKTASLWQRLFSFDALRKERLELSQLSEAQLKDIGITPDQARKEANRPVWDVPANWSQRR